MRFDVLTLFPDLFDSYLEQSLLKKAIDRGLIQILRWNFRDWANGRHQIVDGRPYGGGPGMLLGCQPVVECVEAVQSSTTDPGLVLMMSPRGRRLDQRFVEELSAAKRLLLLCGRYEGFDQRVLEILSPVEVSVGDFITNGGEVPAMVVIDAVMRLVPGVLNDEASHRYESFGESGLLEYPQYTRPREFRGLTVPDVLFTGDHQQIAEWRIQQSIAVTRERRPNLLPDDNSKQHAE